MSMNDRRWMREYNLSTEEGYGPEETLMLLTKSGKRKIHQRIKRRLLEHGQWRGNSSWAFGRLWGPRIRVKVAKP